jgi:hypothetical protein
MLNSPQLTGSKSEQNLPLLYENLPRKAVVSTPKLTNSGVSGGQYPQTHELRGAAPSQGGEQHILHSKARGE